MRTAIYIEDGVTQLVITPESEFEKNAIRSFERQPLEVKVFAGSFYDCRGGWTRQNFHQPSGDYMHHSLDNEDRSLILRMVKAAKVEDAGFPATEPPAVSRV